MKRLQITDYRLQIKIFVLFSVLCSLFSVGYALDDSGEELKLYLGESYILSVSNPSRIAIGNPNVVDVMNVTKNEITLGPKAVGTTTLVFWDNFGEQSFTVKVFSEDINEVKRRVDNMLSKLNLPEVSTQAEEEEGKVILLGRVKNAQDREKIALVLGPLKEKTIDLIEVKEEAAAVEIDVQVLELSKDATNTLGFTWPGTLNIREVGSKGISSTGTDWGKLFHVLDVQRYSDSTTANPFTLKLDALVQEGKARILSRPRLACQSGKEAELLVGGEKPIMTTEVAGTTGAEATEVEYKEYGIKLKIKPTVTDEERIKVALNVEITEVASTTPERLGTESSPTAKAYPFNKRNVSTELFLNDGQTMAIGGLIKQKSEEDITKTPWLGDIPILGLFFRKKVSKIGGGSGERGDTELFITLTPKIIKEEKKVVRPEETKPKRETSVTAPIQSSPEALAAYAKIVQSRILENLTYPALAKDAGFQGTVKLSLHLSYLGELLEAKIKSSSGYSILDDNVLSIAQGIISYPPFPSSIEQKELWIDVPIVYRLD